MRTRNKSIWTSVFVGAVIAAGAIAGPVTLPNTFQPHTPARAAEVNANFAAVKTAVDDNDQRIMTLNTAQATQGAGLTTLQATATSLQTADVQNWKKGGNTGTTAADYLGTADNQSLELRVNARPALTIFPAPSSPNIVFGGVDCPTTLGSDVRGAFVGGGNALGQFSVCGAADRHRVYDHNCVIAGGYGNAAGSNDANLTNGANAAVLGGIFNNASGYAAATLGGDGNIASGSTSLAAGFHANAGHAQSFVVNLGAQSLASTAPNQFAVKAATIYFGNTGNTATTIASAFISTSTGAYLSAGGAWANSSDVSLKKNLQPVSERDVLRAVRTLPVYSWNYRAEDDGVRHIGPTAQDFAAKFSIGADDRHIATVDADGVALAAIKGLAEIVEEQRAMIEAQRGQLNELQNRVNSLTAK